MNGYRKIKYNFNIEIMNNLEIMNNQKITFHLESLRNKQENENEEPMIKILRLFLQIGIEEIHVSPSILNNYMKGLYFINQNQYFFEEYEDELMKIFLDIVKISVSTQRNLRKIANQNGGSKKRGGFKFSSAGFILFVTVSTLLGLTYNYIPEFRESVQIRGSRAGNLVQTYFLNNITINERADELNKITQKYKVEVELLNTRYPNKGEDYIRLKKKLNNREKKEKNHLFYFNSREWKHNIKHMTIQIFDLLYMLITEPNKFSQNGFAQTILIVTTIFNSPLILGKLLDLKQPSPTHALPKTTPGGGSKKKNRTKK